MHALILKLVSGDVVYYGRDSSGQPSDEILKRIMKKEYINVEDDDGRHATILTNKIVGCYTVKKRMTY